MDSASPIVKCTAGRAATAVTGAIFTFTNGMFKAEHVAARWLSLRRSRGHRDTYPRTYGEGPVA
jgi:hypothetical protein